MYVNLRLQRYEKFVISRKDVLLCYLLALNLLSRKRAIQIFLFGVRLNVSSVNARRYL